MKQLDHPNIVKYYTGWYDKEKKKVIIITEMVSGGSLKQNLKSIRSPRLRLLKKWIKEILSGLAYLHSKKIISCISLKEKCAHYEKHSAL